MSKINLIGDKEVREIQRQLEPLSSASWETVERFVKDLLATREAVIKKIEIMPTTQGKSISLDYEVGFLDACHWILDFIRNPKES